MKTIWNWEKRSYGWSASTAREDTVVQIRVFTHTNCHHGFSVDRRGIDGASLDALGLTAVYGNAKSVTNAKCAAETWGETLINLKSRRR